MGRKEVVVVVPVYHFPLSYEEETSARHLLYFLSDHDISLVAPRHLEIVDPHFHHLPVARFPDECFRGIPGYNRLMLSRGFYHRFRQYEFMLIYQLDCLVFSRDLLSWCAKDWDYVGAPWFTGFSPDPADGLWAVGNGGLSLRRVGKFLAVFKSGTLVRDPGERAMQTRLLPRQGFVRKAVMPLKALAHRLGYRNNVNWYLRNYEQHEDHFWGLEASRFVSDFKVPSPREALQFSFESAPGYCFEANGRKLPFGCHAWHKVDREFWEPYTIPPDPGSHGILGGDSVQEKS